MASNVHTLASTMQKQQQNWANKGTGNRLDGKETCETEQNEINLSDIEPKNLSPDEIVQLLIKYLKHMTPEQQENYKKIILNETIHGGVMLGAANDNKEKDEIIDLLKLSHGHKKDFQSLLHNLQKRQEEVDNKCVIPRQEPKTTLPNITQTVTNSGVSIGLQHNSAYETQTIHNASNFYDGEKQCKK